MLFGVSLMLLFVSLFVVLFLTTDLNASNFLEDYATQG